MKFLIIPFKLFACFLFTFVFQAVKSVNINLVSNSHSSEMAHRYKKLNNFLSNIVKENTSNPQILVDERLQTVITLDSYQIVNKENNCLRDNNNKSNKPALIFKTCNDYDDALFFTFTKLDSGNYLIKSELGNIISLINGLVTGISSIHPNTSLPASSEFIVKETKNYFRLKNKMNSCITSDSGLAKVAQCEKGKQSQKFELIAHIKTIVPTAEPGLNTHIIDSPVAVAKQKINLPVKKENKLIEPIPKPAVEQLQGCWVQTSSKGSTMPAVKCNNGDQRVGELCYPACQEHFFPNGVKCQSVCPDEFTDQGNSCRKPSFYGRGIGYAMWNLEKCNKENSQGCEKWGLIYYPKCRANFSFFGCCICKAYCPSAMKDNGDDCAKNSYPRIGYRVGCSDDTQMQAGGCIKKCPVGLIDIGPICQGECPKDYTLCGSLCLKNQSCEGEIKLKYEGLRDVLIADAKMEVLNGDINSGKYDKENPFNNCPLLSAYSSIEASQTSAAVIKVESGFNYSSPAVSAVNSKPFSKKINK